MACVGFPTFALKTTKNYVFVAGGGGNKDYGKQNGIVVFKKENISKRPEDFEDFFKTDDFILHLQVYTSCEEEQNGQAERLLVRERPAVAEKFDTSDSEDACIEELSSMSEEKGAAVGDGAEDGTKSKKEEIDEERGGDDTEREENQSRTDGNVKTKKNGDAKNKEDTLTSLQKNPIFVAGVGDKSFYLLRFDGKFKLCCASAVKIKQAYLNEHLILLKNSTIAGFYNIIHQDEPALNFGIRKLDENAGMAEEYVYKLYRKKKEVVALNDHCTRDIPEDWFKFFICGDSIHKIINEDGKNTFVFHNQKYEIEGKISDFIVQKGRIIFFANREKEGYLYFIDQSSKKYELPKITAIAQFNNTTCVATAQGDVVIYVDGVYSQKHRVATIPISGLGLDNSTIYFCILTGEVECRKYSTPASLIFKLVSVLVLVVAIIIAVVFRYKR